MLNCYYAGLFMTQIQACYMATNDVPTKNIGAINDAILHMILNEFLCICKYDFQECSIIYRKITILYQQNTKQNKWEVMLAVTYCQQVLIVGNHMSHDTRKPAFEGSNQV